MAKGKESATRASASVKVAAPYLPKMSKAVALAAVETQIGQRVKLAEYRATVTPLTPEERDLLIGQAIEMLDQVYAHLPLKRSLHANAANGSEGHGGLDCHW